MFIGGEQNRVIYTTVGAPCVGTDTDNVAWELPMFVSIERLMEAASALSVGVPNAQNR
jgi:hypothetical protein